MITDLLIELPNIVHFIKCQNISQKKINRPLPEMLERGVDVRINVLFRGLPAGGAVTAVVVREDVHPQPVKVLRLY